jgi:hypothetical protein
MEDDRNKLDSKNKINTSTLVVFWIICAFFLMIICDMYINIVIPYLSFIGILPFIIIIMGGLIGLGVALVILAKKATISKLSKIFFILTGASALGIGLSILLHNLVYGLFIKLFGEGVWSNMGDESVFFILATIVFPLTFFVGLIGGIVLIVQKKVKVSEL